MVVSRFLKFSMGNEFIGKILAHLNPPQWAFGPSGVGEHVRKQVVCNSKECSCSASLPHISSNRVCDLEISSGRRSGVCCVLRQ